MYALTDYDYHLPEELISQRPSQQRDKSKLLALRRTDGSFSHKAFNEIYDLLNPSDVLVINNTEVIPGRIYGQKETGGKVELLLIDYAGRVEDNKKTSFKCQCLIKASKQLKQNAAILFENKSLSATVISFDDGIYTIRFDYSAPFETILDQIGCMPLPPYIKRKKNANAYNLDKTTYQTIYASQKGAIAAPTAGLHFTTKLLDRLKSKGIKIAPITLHVGYGTFLPVRAEDIREHKMHAERFTLPEKSVNIINHAKKRGNRVVAVGTTAVRTLEYAARKSKYLTPSSSTCDLFIYPGFQFNIVDAMITNFHLPKSTLLMLVSAFSSRQQLMSAYHEAIKQHYRFYSYGDAMFIY